MKVGAERHVGCVPQGPVLYVRKGRAQGLVEYGLIIALVAVLGIAALIIFGPAITALLSNLGGSV